MKISKFSAPQIFRVWIFSWLKFSTLDFFECARFLNFTNMLHLSVPSYFSNVPVFLNFEEIQNFWVPPKKHQNSVKKRQNSRKKQWKIIEKTIHMKKSKGSWKFRTNHKNLQKNYICKKSGVVGNSPSKKTHKKQQKCKYSSKTGPVKKSGVVGNSGKTPQIWKNVHIQQKREISKTRPHHQNNDKRS